MRIVETGSRNFTEIVCLDEPGQGGACHEYGIRTVVPVDVNTIPQVCASVSFQNGPIKEAGVNGCHQEDLIAIVIDRLEHFQAGEYKCRENALALTKFQEGLAWLNHRTNKRIERGVEGTHEK